MCQGILHERTWIIDLKSSISLKTAKAINEGPMQCCDEDTDVEEEDIYGKLFKYWECKGKSCVHTSLLSWTRPANGIGCPYRRWVQYVRHCMPLAKDLLSFILDVTQLVEMHRIRMTLKDRYYYGEQSFWANMTTFVVSDPIIGKDHQCLRDTMRLERLGTVRYDLETLGLNMLDRFKFCRDNLGMNDLPYKGQGTLGV